MLWSQFKVPVLFQWETNSRLCGQSDWTKCAEYKKASLTTVVAASWIVWTAYQTDWFVATWFLNATANWTRSDWQVEQLHSQPKQTVQALVHNYWAELLLANSVRYSDIQILRSTKKDYRWIIWEATDEGRTPANSAEVKLATTMT